MFYHFSTNANVDLIVRGTELLKALGIEPATDSDRKELATLDDLQQTFHYFFRKGAGAERSFTSSEVFKQIIQTAASLSSAEVRKRLILWSLQEEHRNHLYLGVLPY